MSGEETVRTLRADRESTAKALRADALKAQEAMKAAGFAVADHDTPLYMVAKLIRKNQGQQQIEDGLRERLKAAEDHLARTAELDRLDPRVTSDALKAVGLAPADSVIEVDTLSYSRCPFWRPSGECRARGGYDHCAMDPVRPDDRHKLRSRPPCRLDEGPVLVKKAEEDSGNDAAQERGRE